MIFAYLDPGAGSMVIQVVIAGALAVPFFLRTQIGRFLGRLRHRPAGDGTRKPGDPSQG